VHELAACSQSWERPAARLAWHAHTPSAPTPALRTAAACAHTPAPPPYRSNPRQHRPSWTFSTGALTTRVPRRPGPRTPQPPSLHGPPCPRWELHGVWGAGGAAGPRWEQERREEVTTSIGWEETRGCAPPPAATGARAGGHERSLLARRPPAALPRAQVSWPAVPALPCTGSS